MLRKPNLSTASDAMSQGVAAPCPAVGSTTSAPAHQRELHALRPKEDALRNEMNTARYSWLPVSHNFFLFKMPYEQMQRKANVYFLIVGLVQLVPGISPTGEYTTLTTLACILLFSMGRSAFEDYKRRVNDRTINDTTYHVLEPTVGPAAGASTPRAGASNSGADSSETRKRQQQQHELQELVVLIPPMPTEPGDEMLIDDAGPGIGVTRQSFVGFDWSGAPVNASATIAQNPLLGPGRRLTAAPEEATIGSDGAQSLLAEPSYPAKWRAVRSCELRPGDVIIIAQPHILPNSSRHLPCDVVIIDTSDRDGQCFIETSGLDGETALKTRRGLVTTHLLPRVTKRDEDGSLRDGAPCTPSMSWMAMDTRQTFAPDEEDVSPKEQAQRLDRLASSAFGFVEKLTAQVDNPNGHLKTFDGAFRCPFAPQLAQSNSAQQLTAGRQALPPQRHLQQIPESLRAAGGGVSSPRGSNSSSLLEVSAANRDEFGPYQLSQENVIYCGSSLRKIDWAVGLVVYTGMETKIMMNSTVSRHKISRLERLINTYLLIVFAFLVVLCLLTSMGEAMLRDTKFWYLRLPSNKMDFITFVGSFATHLILFNNLIPISLYVTLEFVKLCQGYFMEQDLGMYCEELDCPAVIKSTDLNEEIGQVTHVFADKTGTLTRNVMSLLRFSVAGQNFGTTLSEVTRSSQWRSGTLGANSASLEKDAEEGGDDSDSKGHIVEGFFDPRVNGDHWLSLPCAPQLKQFFTHLAVCHTVIASRNGEELDADSPDEEALVRAARYFGFKFLTRDSRKMTIMSQGRVEEYTIHAVLDFTPERRRMSVVVTNADGVTYIFVKGAENVVLNRLRTLDPLLPSTLESVKQFASEGLRTLVFAQRVIPHSELSDWLEEYKAVKQLHLKRSDRAARFKIVTEWVECNLSIVGCTGMEDKLQEGVTQTIAALHEGGIRTWLLTGDRWDTTLTISTACGLARRGMQVAQLVDVRDAKVVDEILGTLLMKKKDATSDDEGPEQCLVVEGSALDIIFDDATDEVADERRRRFFDVAQASKTVLCCRASPRHKAAVVSLVKTLDASCVALAIGDGSNDIPMLHAADVGVGLRGKEGHQAANAADMILSEFRFLSRLLFVHGRENYHRLSRLVGFFAYKCTLLVFMQFWYLLFSQWTGLSIVEKWSLASYNVAWTSVPVIVFAIFDKQVRDESHNSRFAKILYAPNVKGTTCNLRVLLSWSAEGVLHSLVAFFPVMLGWTTTDRHGRPAELPIKGIVVYTLVILFATLRVVMIMNILTWVHHYSIIVTFVSWFLFIAIYSTFPAYFNTTYKDILHEGLTTTAPWLFLMAGIGTIFIIVLSWRFLTLRIPKLTSSIDLLRIYDERYYVAPEEAAEFQIDPNESHETTRLSGGAKASKTNRFASSSNSFAQPPVTQRAKIAAMLQTSTAASEKGDFDQPVQNWLLQFVDPALEEQFIRKYAGSLMRHKVAFGLGSVATLVVAYSQIVGIQTTSTADVLQAFMWLFFALTVNATFLVFLYVDCRRFLHHLLLVVCFFVFSTAAIGNLLASSVDPTSHPVALGVTLLIVLVFRPPLVHAMQYVLIGLLCYLCWYQAFPVSSWQTYEFALRFVEVVSVAVTSLICLFHAEYYMRLMFISQLRFHKALERLTQEERRSMALLHNILPSPVVTEMLLYRREASQFSVRVPQASVVVAQLLGFSTIFGKVDAHAAVNAMSRIHSKFDSVAVSLGAEKTWSVGDCFVYCTGLPIADPFHTEKAVTISLLLVEAVQEVNDELHLAPADHQSFRSVLPASSGGPPDEANRRASFSGSSNTPTHSATVVKVAIACASGPLRTGIVGIAKFCYSVVGEPVQTARAMITNGMPNKVQVTREIFDKTENIFEYAKINERLYPLRFKLNENGKLSVSAVERQKILALPTGRVEVAPPNPHDVVDTILNDDDADRRNIIDRWSGFDGRPHPVTLQFKEKRAEGSFRTYFTSLATTRVVYEALQASYMLAATGVLLFLVQNKAANTFIWVVFGGCFAHAAIVAFAALRYVTMTLTEKELDKSAIDRLVKSASEFRMERSAAERSENRALPGHEQEDEEEEEEKVRPLRRAYQVAFAIISGGFSLAIVPAALELVPGGTSVSVFIVLINTCYVFSFLHLRIWPKVLLLWAHFIAVSITFFQQSDRKGQANYFGIVVGYLIMSFAAFVVEQSIRHAYGFAKRVVVQETEVMSAVALSSKLMEHALPLSVSTRLRRGVEIADHFLAATVVAVVIDDAGNEEHDAGGVQRINRIVSMLDGLADKHGLTTVKPSPYIVFSPHEGIHCEAAIRFAIEALVAISRVTEAAGEIGLTFRIAIDTGPVVAGILGQTRFGYELIGRPLNVAILMAQRGDEGHITVSEAVCDTGVGSSVLTNFRCTMDLGEYGSVSTYTATRVDGNEILDVGLGADDFSLMGANSVQRGGGRRFLTIDKSPREGELPAAGFMSSTSFAEF